MKEYLRVIESGMLSLLYGVDPGADGLLLAYNVLAVRTMQGRDGGISVMVMPIAPMFLRQIDVDLEQLPPGMDIEIASLPVEERTELHRLVQEYEEHAQAARAARAGLVFPTNLPKVQ